MLSDRGNAKNGLARNVVPKECAERFARHTKKKMMNTWDDFIFDLTKIDSLRLVKDEAFEEWGVDIPATLLFAKFGKGIVEKWERFSLSERSYIFNVIELGMQTKDDHLKALIATGLLESLYTGASHDSVLWEHMYGQLGEVSRQYLLDWGSWSRS
jgi:hypothetical protein